MTAAVHLPSCRARPVAGILRDARSAPRCCLTHACSCRALPVQWNGADILLIRNGGRGPIERVVANQFQTAYPMPSPDGRWFAFVSNQSGEQEVFVRSLDPRGEEIQVSQGGGTEPLWSPNGRELYYRGAVEGRIKLMAAAIRTSPKLEVDSRTALFSLDDIVGATPHANYAISPDGKTFVMVRRAAANRIIVLQNLPELVRRIREAGSAAR